MNFILIISCYILFLISPTRPTIDVNLSEFQYIADHLTEEECRRLVAALHFRNYELPKEINAAERRLPENTSCLNLLLQWNSTPSEGKGETQVEVTHRLNQIGRNDLAEWLSKTVFHEISKDLKNSLNSTEIIETTLSVPSTTEAYDDEKVEDEAAWLKIDSILSILIVFGLLTLTGGALLMCCFWCCTTSEKPKHGYKKLPTRGN